MRRWLLMIGSLSLAACGPAAPVDCREVEQELNACLDRNRRSEIEHCFEKHVPLGAATRYHGTWATSFEFNQFSNGEAISSDRAFEYRSAPIELDVGGTELEKYVTNDRARVLEVDFIGRKFLCSNLTRPVSYIRVGKVIAARTIEERPSGWY